MIVTEHDTAGMVRLCSGVTGRTLALVTHAQVAKTLNDIDELADLADKTTTGTLTTAVKTTIAKATADGNRVTPTVALWAATITDVIEQRADTTGIQRIHKHVPFIKADERYTLGPVYVPGRLDGHGEHISSGTLQKSIWDWVRAGDRTIFLQHTEKAAGEMVEILTWPAAIDTTIGIPGEAVQKVSFPAGTPFMGVVWEPDAWDVVKAGKLRGYSIGGRARRVEADLPDYS